MGMGAGGLPRIVKSGVKSGVTSGAIPTRAERIGAALTERIVSGGMAPGCRLDEQVLATEFGVSRTPVREALRQLVSTGLVEFRARRGVVVACPDAEALADSFEVLAELEGLCARWSARRMTPAERAGLDAFHRQMAALVRNGDRAGYSAANLAIHALVGDGAHNVSLTELVAGLNRRLSPFRGAQFEEPERLARSHTEHGAVVVAVLRGDADAAADAMRDHIRSSGRSWRDMSHRIGRPLANDQDAA